MIKASALAARGVAGAGVLVLLLTFAIQLTVPVAVPSEDLLPDWALAAFLLAMFAFPICGGLVAIKRPRNPVGWLFCAMGLLVGTSGLVGELGQLAEQGVIALDHSGLASTQEWLGNSFILIPPIVFLIFPNGRPLSSASWRAVMLVCVAWASLQIVAQTVIAWVAWVEWARAVTAAGIATVVLYPISVASLYVRYRAAGAAERQQLKWFLYGANLVGVEFALLGLVFAIGSEGLRLVELGVIEELPWLGMLIALASLPITAAIAIVRHGLFDIDVLISRTLVYGALSAVLAATYLATVVLAQGALRPFTGGSEIAVAASTLVTLALVQPLRARIKDAIDQRFYRSRYDAARTLDDLTRRLRDEVDLDTLRSDVVDAVTETLRPAHVGLWLLQEPK